MKNVSNKISIMTFRSHVVRQITGRLYENARLAYEKNNYKDVIFIGLTQYPYNVSAATVYYDLSKDESYNLIKEISHPAIKHFESEHDKIHAKYMLEGLKVLTDYYDDIFDNIDIRSWSPNDIKK